MPDRHLEDSDALAFPEEDAERRPVEPRIDLDDEDGAAPEPASPRRRRWFGRRREAPAQPEGAVANDDEKPAPDWNAVITGHQGDSQWTDWSTPVRTSEPEAAEAAPAEVEAHEETVAVWETDEETEAPEATDGPATVTATSADAPADELAAAPEAPVAPATEDDEDEAEAPAADELVAPAEAPVALPAEAEGATPAAVDAPPPPTATDGEAAAGGEEEPPPIRYRSTPSWPPPPRPRIGAGILCLLVTLVLVVLLVTNGQIGPSGEESRSDSAEARPALRTDPASVPKDWIVYRNADIEFGISYPPGWTVREEGRVVLFADPGTGAELRIEHRRPPGSTDPEETWIADERTVTTKYADYRRLQLSPASYLEHKAALWEYTFSDGNRLRHAADLGFVTKRDRFALLFEANTSDWERMLPVFQGFLSSFKTPK